MIACLDVFGKHLISGFSGQNLEFLDGKCLDVLTRTQEVPIKVFRFEFTRCLSRSRSPADMIHPEDDPSLLARSRLIRRISAMTRVCERWAGVGHVIKINCWENWKALRLTRAEGSSNAIRVAWRGSCFLIATLFSLHLRTQKRGRKIPANFFPVARRWMEIHSPVMRCNCVIIFYGPSPADGHWRLLSDFSAGINKKDHRWHRRLRIIYSVDWKNVNEKKLKIVLARFMFLSMLFFRDRLKDLEENKSPAT